MEKKHPSSDNPPPIPRPPTILDGFVQPKFIFGRVFTCFFLHDCLVFVKTGSFSTDIGGNIRAALGGATSDAILLGALGSVLDQRNSEKRINKAAAVASWDAEQMVAAHKWNFRLAYNSISVVKLKGPNFAGELRIFIEAGNEYKFRLDKQSKQSAAYCEKVFNEFLPGKIIRR